LISQSTPLVTGVDKPQVSALKQNRGKFVKKPNDSIRRKFSIDAVVAIVRTLFGGIHHFETIPPGFRKLAIHHLHRMRRANGANGAPARAVLQVARAP
jgi:hypothetical protein